jgi:hypothetical protein
MKLIVLLGAAAAAFVAADIVNPQYSPLAEPVSRYVNGTAGWLIPAAIAAIAVASAVLARRARGAGRWLLAVWTAGLAVAAAVPADPPGQYANPSTAEMVHGVAALVALTAFPAAAMLLAGTPLSRRLAVASIVGTAGFLVLLFDVTDGPSLTVGGTSLLGLAERVAIAADLGWLAVFSATRTAPERENRVISGGSAG